MNTKILEDKNMLKMKNVIVKMQRKPKLNTKKTTLLSLIICLFYLQIQAQISLGGGLGYNEKISGPGITLKGVFNTETFMGFV